jgi:hypothetical protein
VVTSASARDSRHRVTHKPRRLQICNLSVSFLLVSIRQHRAHQ